MVVRATQRTIPAAPKHRANKVVNYKYMGSKAYWVALQWRRRVDDQYLLPGPNVFYTSSHTARTASLIDCPIICSTHQHFRNIASVGDGRLSSSSRWAVYGGQSVLGRREAFGEPVKPRGHFHAGMAALEL